AIKFYKKALKKGIRPVIGVEAYMAPGDRRDRQPAQGQKKPYHHLVLLAENYTGYKNLIKLVSQGFQEGFYYKPRIDRALLAERMRYTQEHYFKSGEEMERLFEDLPEAIENTATIAGRCHLLLEGDRPPLPDFSVPEGRTTDEYFEEVARGGFRERMAAWKGF